jgi:hypothetical protein
LKEIHLEPTIYKDGDGDVVSFTFATDPDSVVICIQDHETEVTNAVSVPAAKFTSMVQQLVKIINEAASQEETTSSDKPTNDHHP